MRKMKNIVSSTAYLLGTLLLLPALVFAQSRHPYRAKILYVQQRNSDIVLTGRSAILGNFHVALRSKQLKDFSAFKESFDGTLLPEEIPGPRLSQGTIRLPQRKSALSPRTQRVTLLRAAGAEFLGSRGNHQITFAVKSRRASAARFFELSFKRDLLADGRAPFEARLRHIPSYALLGKSCAAHQAAGSFEARSAVGSPGYPIQAASRRVVDLVTDCDLECAQRIGAGQANAQIAAFVNTADAIYSDQLGLTFNLVQQIRRSSSSTYPASLRVPLNLLERFRGIAQDFPSSDVKHLITGKDMNDDVIGLAYVGAVCTDPSFATGWSQHSNSLLTPITMAHEIGHNLNADHTPSGIMSASLSIPPPTSFSTASRAQIGDFVSSVQNLCLEEEEDIPPPTPQVNFKYRYRANNRFVATISVPQGFSGCSVSLRAASSNARALNSPRTVGSELSIPDTTRSLKVIITGLRPLRGKEGREKKIFFASEVSCAEGGALTNPIKSLNVARDVPLATSVGSKKAWIDQLAVNLAAQNTN